MTESVLIPPPFTRYESASGQDHFAAPPPRRVGALGIIRDAQGRVLFCKKKPRDLSRAGSPWNLPGGCVERNEEIRAALVRTVGAKIGIGVTPGRLLAVHHMQDAEQIVEETARYYLSREGLNFVLDCGTLSSDTEFRYGARVIEAQWFDPGELREHLIPFMADRTEAALRALVEGDAALLSGNPLQ
jgi:ADP-ribose pyrophosphatase YjhB (NUDIX family)